MSNLRERIFTAAKPALILGFGLALAATLAVNLNIQAFSQSSTEEETQIAKSLAIMLQAGRTVVSRNQDRINDPKIGNKGLDSKTILVDTIKIYQEMTKIDPNAIDPKSRHGKLIRIQMDSIAEVIDVHQQTFNRQGVG